ncbi:MAG TPA: hypothetical protein VGD26_08485, partial [Chitinophagaceae bacterium]
MGDGSVDITKWIERMVHKNGLTSFKVEFHKPPQTPQPEVSHDRTAGKEPAESTKRANPPLQATASSTKRANPPLQATASSTKETAGPSEWQDLDTLLFPEDK